MYSSYFSAVSDPVIIIIKCKVERFDWLVLKVISLNTAEIDSVDWTMFVCEMHTELSNWPHGLILLAQDITDRIWLFIINGVFKFYDQNTELKTDYPCWLNDTTVKVEFDRKHFAQLN